MIMFMVWKLDALYGLIECLLLNITHASVL